MENLVFLIFSIFPRGRTGIHHVDSSSRELELDLGKSTNPCGEIVLESYELCNLSEVFPTRCFTDGKFDESKYMKAFEYATFYTCCLSLIATHRPETNAVIARNRRTGVSISGISQLYTMIPFTYFVKLLRKAYKHIREVNMKLAKEAGVVSSIRVSTVKPSGSISLLAGCTAGLHFPTFTHCIRRIRVADDSPIANILIKNNVYHEKDVVSKNTLVFEFPITYGAETRADEEVSIWEKFSLCSVLQREYSDNSVSVTITFKKNEEDQIEHALSQNIPSLKTVSLLPLVDVGAYPQMPLSRISKEEYDEKVKKHPKLDFSELTGSDGIYQKFCSNDTCDM